MNHKKNPKATAKLYQEDVVQLVNEPKSYGLVVRCWHDAEDLPPTPEDVVVDPLMRPLKPGEVGVSFYPQGAREILPESQLNLIDRVYQPGDLLKRSIDDLCAGIVTSIEVQGRLEHAITGEEIPGWKTSEDLHNWTDVDMGDYVVRDDWVGQVVEMFDESIIEMAGGNIVRLPELSARLSTGQKGPNILPPPTLGVQGFFGFLQPAPRPGNQDTVLIVKHTVLAIAWLAINQTLSAAESAARSRPPRFISGSDLSKLTLIRRRAEQAMRVGDRVILKDNDEAPVSHHGKPGELFGFIQVRTLVVRETRTRVNVLWQDGTREWLNARDTIPYLNPDEYDCWPGDHVLWKNEDEKRPAIVLSVNAVERTAQIRFTDTKATELVSVLELDPHGTTDWVTPSAGEGLGVHRGEFVFIHPDSTTNGAQVPMVPRIGELEEWVREVPSLTCNGHLTGWRRDVAALGNRIAETRGKDPEVVDGHISQPEKGDSSFNWFGEVIDLRLDGTVEVMLPDSSTIILPLKRVTRLYDGLEQIEDMWGEDDLEGSVDTSHLEFESDEGGWTIRDDEGGWVVDTANPADWTDEEDNTSRDPERWYSLGPGEFESGDSEGPLISVLADEGHRVLLSTPDCLTPPALRAPTPDTPKDALEPDSDHHEENGMMDGPSQWKRFEVLSSAPPDHAFYSSPPAQPSRSFLGRLAKEYRVLSTTLPETILVRAYEDRSDLLRSLIIGPENTPYEDAPFVIDWQLDSNFPHSPPIAHFLSWTNGNGRVNPNLYEEGKVCLSILGTWAGDKNETWSASRSSLLQALVSIQGLVLVKEPWFCEPAYEKLRGTKEGIVNSRLYSEKAYVLSRGFVRRALEIPLGGLEEEINWLYYTNSKLDKVLRNSRALIEKSKALPSAKDADADMETEGDWELAVPRLTGGGIIMLERTLAKLEVLKKVHGSDPLTASSSSSSSSSSSP